jgi:hypothetical protein
LARINKKNTGEFMKNLKLLLLCIPFLTINCDDSYNVHNITFESLAHDLWTDHVLVFEEIFKLMPISTILEIGSSKASKYLAENCINLVTYEIALKDLFNSIMPPFIEINSKIKPHFPFWHIEMQTLKDNVNDANNLAQQGKNPLSNESSYIEEIKHLFDKACEYKTFDIIFIDPRIYLRADFVNETFNRSDIIIAHDTNFNAPVYGWDRIKAPLNYEKIHFNYGSGTTIWIKNDKKKLIHELKTNLQDKESRLKIQQEVHMPIIPQQTKIVQKSESQNECDYKTIQASLWEQLRNTETSNN